MADKIKGITIELDGDARKLNNAVKSVASRSKEFQDELRKVERLLKFDPKNTELLAQKQKLLTDSVDHTREALQKFKDAKADADKTMAAGGKVSEEQYRHLQREIIETEQKLRGLEKAQSDFNSKAKKAADSMSDFGSKVSDAGNKIMPVSAAAGAAIGGVVALAVNSAAAADELNTLSKQTGMSTEELQKFSYAADLIDVPLETIAGSLPKLTKAMGRAKDGSKATIGVFDELGVAWDDGTGKLRDNSEVFYELIDALGEVENETERDRMAMELFGKSATDLNPLIMGGAEDLKKYAKEWEEMGLVLSQTDLDKLNAFNDEIDKTKAVVSGTGQALGAEFAEILMPLLQDLVKMLSGLLEAVRNMSPETKKFILIILGIVAAIGPLLIFIGQMSVGIGALIGILPVLGGALAFITGPFGIVIAAVVAVIAIFVLFNKNMDAIKEKAAAMYENIKASFAKTRDSIVNPIMNAIDTLKKINLFEIGKNIISGLIDGVKAMIAKVKETIGNIAETITGGIKKALKIQSPSRVMEGLGEYTGEGLIKGLESTKRALSSVSNSMGSVATAGAGAGSMMHSGTIRVEGINDKNQLVGVADIVMEQLRREARRR